MNLDFSDPEKLSIKIVPVTPAEHIEFDINIEFVETGDEEKVEMATEFFWCKTDKGWEVVEMGTVIKPAMISASAHAPRKFRKFRRFDEKSNGYQEHELARRGWVLGPQVHFQEIACDDSLLDDLDDALKSKDILEDEVSRLNSKNAAIEEEATKLAKQDSAYLEISKTEFLAAKADVDFYRRKCETIESRLDSAKISIRNLERQVDEANE